MKKPPLYQFVGLDGTFRVEDADRQGALYFPLVNEQGCLSSIAPDLGGDIKLDQHSFLTLPVSYEDLHLSRAARNFWIGVKGAVPWSVCGRSVWQRAVNKVETHKVEAGFLWHRITRTNKKLGIEARVLNFVPAHAGSFEVMQVEIKNISNKSLIFTATSAIPLFGRSADNLRDHRHVTSLLHRLTREKYGVGLCPTMSFNERGHLINTTSYYVLGADDKGAAPRGVFGTVASFVGLGGDLERPLSLIERKPVPSKITDADQGKEAMGALQFKPRTLKKGETASFTLLLGIDKNTRHCEERRPATKQSPVSEVGDCFVGLRPPRNDEVQKMLQETKEYWDQKISTLRFRTGNAFFNQWIRWVQTQPMLRKLFGCSFLPDFDYGRGGRGWRDLWQDCLALILADPQEVREDIRHNFGGVRIDGSNATILGRVQVGGKWVPEFIADRNNISRTWMDHGVWPFLTTLLYLNQTGDWGLLLEKVPYFSDVPDINPQMHNKLKTKDGRIYSGTIFEHFLLQTLVQFFNVGEHNIIRLEDADWNDGLDMARDRGESVAFTSMYGGNLKAMAELLERLVSKAGWTQVAVAEEIIMLLDRVRGRINYDSVSEKRQRLEDYYRAVSKNIGGGQALIPIDQLISDLREKSDWITQHLNKNEWMVSKDGGWYNGYYDNKGRRVEGMGLDGRVRMTLSGQVYAIMAGVAPDERVRSVIKAVDRHLFDKKLGGVRLNTDFGGIQSDLGRAFSFVYGEKENGAVFSHMAVMYASALYQRGYAKEGHRVLDSLFRMAKNSACSRIYPGLPEYFNNEAQGRYMYLTGSASWYVLTLLTQIFGVRGLGGDLLLAPKLGVEQYDEKGTACVNLRFAGSEITVNYLNTKRVSAEKARIKSVATTAGSVPFTRLSDGEVLIQREMVTQQSTWNLQVTLEELK